MNALGLLETRRSAWKRREAHGYCGNAMKHVEMCGREIKRLESRGRARGRVETPGVVRKHADARGYVLRRTTNDLSHVKPRGLIRRVVEKRRSERGREETI